MNILSKILTTFAFCLLFITFLAAPAYAAEPTATLQDFQKAVKDQKYNKESFDLQSTTGLLSSLTTLLIGCTISTTDEKGKDKIDYKQCPESIRVGALPTIGVTIASITTSPPASGKEYLADLGQKLNIVQPAYAQGRGFRDTQAFLPAWRAARNLTYVLFVIAAIIFGVMIMFRTRISPQTVITIQSALPRIIIALIFVTFSYAILGLLIDLIYVAFGLLVYGLQSFGLTTYDPVATYREFTTASFGQTTGFIFQRGLTGGIDIIRGIPEASLEIAGGIGTIIGTLIIWLTRLAAPARIAIGVAALPVLLGLVLAILFFFLRVLFALAKAYILLLIYLILAPLLILFAVISNTGIWLGWLRGALANLLVFPAVGLVIFLTSVLIALVDQATAGGLNMWAPPYVGGSASIIKGMIALGGVMLLPNIPDIINQLLGTRPIPIQLPAAGAQLQRIFGEIGQAASRATCLSADTLIDTPYGFRVISELRAGMSVWSLDSAGCKVATILTKVIATPAPHNHQVVALLLGDGRNLFVSPGHPTIDGRTIGNLATGDILDGARIVKADLVDYGQPAVYDILPEGNNGAYWANGILIGSTLVPRYNYSPQILV